MRCEVHGVRYNEKISCYKFFTMCYMGVNRDYIDEMRTGGTHHTTLALPELCRGQAALPEYIRSQEYQSFAVELK